MSSPIQKPLSEVEVDRDHLYREESFTDLKVATIRRLVPIKPDGSENPHLGGCAAKKQIPISKKWKLLVNPI